jgi:predicted Co/Zn/Cd cation transporter (cation efflux family)
MTERHALLLSTAAALMLGAVGVIFALATDSRAIMLDGLFNLTYFVIALMTIRVAALAARPDTPEFPFGHAYFESLVNAGKGLLILGISVLALIDAAVTIAAGGRDIVAGLAIGYAAFATVACALTAVALKYAHRRQPGPLVEADVANWVLNTIVSGTVLAAFCLVPLLHALNRAAWAAYVDPILVALVVTLFIGVPIRIARRAILELLNRAPPEDIAGPVRDAVRQALADLPVQNLYLRMVRPGRTLYLVVHAVMPDDFRVGRLATLDALRERVDAAVRKVHPRAVVDAMFTASERWAAPGTGDD